MHIEFPGSAGRCVNSLFGLGLGRSNTNEVSGRYRARESKKELRELQRSEK